MKALALAAALLALPAAAVDREMRDGADVVRLTQDDCIPEILAALPADTPPRMRLSFRRAHVDFRGETFRACWVLLPNGDVFLRYEDGDAGLLPWQAFRIVRDT